MSEFERGAWHAETERRLCVAERFIADRHHDLAALTAEVMRLRERVAILENAVRVARQATGEE